MGGFPPGPVPRNTQQKLRVDSHPELFLRKKLAMKSPSSPEVVAIVDEHLKDMGSGSPAQSQV